MKSDQPSIVAEFFGFQNWHEVVEFSQTTEGEHLRTFVKVVAKHGEQKLIEALGKTAHTEDQADIVVSTAHKAKGREWPTVRLIDDFLKSKPDNEEHRIDPAEVRLFYVALTRAQKAVDVALKTLSIFQISQGEKYPRPKNAVRASDQNQQAAPSETARPIPTITTPPAVESKNNRLAWYWWLFFAVLFLGFLKTR